MALRIDERLAVVEQRVARDGGSGGSAVVGDRGLGLGPRGAERLEGSRRTPSYTGVEVAGKVRELRGGLSEADDGLGGRTLEGAGRAKLEGDVVGGHEGVGGRDVVGVVAAGWRVGGRHEDSEMALVAITPKCRSPAEKRRK